MSRVQQAPYSFHVLNRDVNMIQTNKMYVLYYGRNTGKNNYHFNLKMALNLPNHMYDLVHVKTVEL